MTLAAFIARYLGQAVLESGDTSPQCVGLVNAWATQGQGKPRLVGNAYQLLALAPPAVWTRTSNTPTNFPPAGAIVVWDANVPGLLIGPYGHTGIALLADGVSLITLDQNWAGKEYPAVFSHTYVGVAGWLTPR